MFYFRCPQRRRLGSPIQELLHVDVGRQQDTSRPLEELSTVHLKSAFMREVQSTSWVLETKPHSVS